MSPKISLKPGNFNELKKILPYFKFLRYISIEKGLLYQEIEENIFIECDFSSILGKNDFHIINDQSEIKELKLLEPGNNDAEIREGENEYFIKASKNECKITKYYSIIENFEKIDFSKFKSNSNSNLTLTGKDTEDFLNISNNKGPIKLIMNAKKYLLKIVNNKGTVHYISNNIANIQEENFGQEFTYLSYILHEIDSIILEIKIYEEEIEDDPVYGKEYIWVEFICEIGTNFKFHVYEKLLPDFSGGLFS